MPVEAHSEGATREKGGDPQPGCPLPLIPLQVTQPLCGATSLPVASGHRAPVSACWWVAFTMDPQPAGQWHQRARGTARAGPESPPLRCVHITDMASCPSRGLSSNQSSYPSRSRGVAAPGPFQFRPLSHVAPSSCGAPPAKALNLYSSPFSTPPSKTPLHGRPFAT